MRIKLRRRGSETYRSLSRGFPRDFFRVRLPRLTSDGMVLQRYVNLTIWGWAAPDSTVTVRFGEKSYHSGVDAEGQWAITMGPFADGGPYRMIIVSGKQAIVVQNILIGDVWICAGQSNMVFPMSRADERYAEEIAHCNDPTIRQFIVPDCWDFEKPHHDVESGRWESADSKTVLNFTAVGYFFAKSLIDKIHVPIGLIKTCVGGTPVDAWLSEDALKAFPVHLEKALQFKNRAFRDRIVSHDKALSDSWYGRLDSLDLGLGKEGLSWFDPAYNASTWPTMQLPGYWADQGLGELNGVVWFRKEVEIPASMTGKPAKIYLGCIVDSDRVYVNGELVGSISYRYPPRRYDIPPNLLKAGKNVIVVRVVNTLGRGGFVPDKQYRLRADRESFDLKGEWRYRVGAVMEPLPEQTFFSSQPLGLFNGMLAPLLHVAMKGVLWYQGESNDKDPSDYAELFQALIADWRQKWKRGDFPFLYVQLPNFGESKDLPTESVWAKLREAQLKTLKVPHTGMAVAIDSGEWNDLHPLNKKTIGQRLALAARRVAYGDQDIIDSGPIYRSMKIEGQTIVISFRNTGSGLIVKNDGELKHFAIAGADHHFVWAKAVIKGEQVVVWSDQVTRPVAVRYAWADNPEGANLYNKEMLPASPFRTDDAP